MKIVEFGLELERLEEVLNQLEIYTSMKELVQLYLRGISNSFKDVRQKIYSDMEQDRHGHTSWPNPTLMEVRMIVEQRAIRDGLLDIVSGGREVNQNNQQVQGTKASPKKLTKAQKSVANHKRTIAALQQKVDAQSSTKSTTQEVKQNVAAPKSDRKCNHGKKCWLKDCKYQHEKGHKPAQDPTTVKCSTCERMGHNASQCGKCYRCNSPDHSYRNCPERSNKVHQNSQQVLPSAPSAEDDQSVLMRL